MSPRGPRARKRVLSASIRHGALVFLFFVFFFPPSGGNVGRKVGGGGARGKKNAPPRGCAERSVSPDASLSCARKRDTRRLMPHARTFSSLAAVTPFSVSKFLIASFTVVGLDMMLRRAYYTQRKGPKWKLKRKRKLSQIAFCLLCFGAHSQGFVDASRVRVRTETSVVRLVSLWSSKRRAATCASQSVWRRVRGRREKEVNKRRKKS